MLGCFSSNHSRGGLLRRRHVAPKTLPGKTWDEKIRVERMSRTRRPNPPLCVHVGWKYVQVVACSMNRTSTTPAPKKAGYVPLERKDSRAVRRLDSSITDFDPICGTGWQDRVCCSPVTREYLSLYISSPAPHARTELNGANDDP